METTKHVSQVIPGSLESLHHPTTVQRLISWQEKSLNGQQLEWSRRWLRIKTLGDPQLERMERTFVGAANLMHKQPGDGVLIVAYGRNGTGKTTCARGLADWAFKWLRLAQYVPRGGFVRSPATQFWSWPELLDALKGGSWGIVKELFPPSHDPESNTGCELLIIDELGGGHDPTFVGVDKLCQILSARENAWTVVTTNILPAAWETSFDLRVKSRLHRNAVHIDLSEVPDYATR